MVMGRISNLRLTLTTKYFKRMWCPRAGARNNRSYRKPSRIMLGLLLF